MTTPHLKRQFPDTRLRRMRAAAFSRNLMAETKLSAHDLIYPVFLTEGESYREAIASMPGVYRMSLDVLLVEAKECLALGIPALALFLSLIHI